MPAGEPLREEEEHRRRHAGFGETEHDAHQVELPRGLDQRPGDDNNTPAQHDPDDPSSGTESPRQAVAGDLEEDEADEDQSTGQAEGDIGEPDVGRQFRLYHPDVDPVDVGHEVRENDDWHEPPRYFPNGGLLDAVRG